MGREVGWCGRSKSGLVHTTNVLWGMTVEANRHRRSGKLVYRLVRQFTTSVGRSGRDEFRIKQIFRDLWGIFHYCFHYYRGRGILRQFPKTTWIQKYHVCQSWILFLNFRSNCGRRNFFRRPMPETMFTSKEPPDAVGNIFGRKRGVFLDVAREIPRLKVMKPHNNIRLLTVPILIPAPKENPTLLPSQRRMPPKPPRIPLHFIHPSKTLPIHTASIPPNVVQYPIILKTQAPDEFEPVQRLFGNRQCWIKWVSTYKRAALKAFASPTHNEEILSENLYSCLDVNRVYGISSPFHTERKTDLRHNQIADPAFEEKCRHAVSRYLISQGVDIQDRERTLYENVLRQNATHMPPKPIAAIEWNGLWMDADGIYYLLECKHFMTSVFIWCYFANHVVEIDEPSMGSHSENCETSWNHDR